jgi:hypothetical protein
VCGNCFVVCTTSDGTQDASFDWRLSAARGDDYVVTDTTQTDDEGLLCIETFKPMGQMNKDGLNVLSKTQLKQIMDKNELVYTASQTKAALVNIIVANQS